MNKQTAVQWLFEQLCSEKLSWSKDCNGKLFIDVVTSDILQKAKQMEREQIEDAFKHGQNNGFMYHERGFDTISSNQFYKQTYGGEK
jgi:hypothetical protein